MLFNYQDTPRDLYERMIVNIEMNEFWSSRSHQGAPSKIYSYPMRYAPIDEFLAPKANRNRDYVVDVAINSRNWLKYAAWTRRFIRNIEIMKGAANGAISPTPTLARRTIGETYEEFLANLYMPEKLLRDRNKHERRIYDFEPKRKPGSGKVEEFRDFILRLLKKQDADFRLFHETVSENSSDRVRECLRVCKNKEMRKWLKLYLK